MKTRRTTLILDEDLYRQVKRYAVDRDTRLKDVVRDALQTYLVTSQDVTAKPAHPVHRSWPLGVKAPLTREAIYEDYLNRKFRRRR